MYCTNPPSGNSSGTILGVLSEALLQGPPEFTFAHLCKYQAFTAKILNKFNFYR